MGGTTTVVSDCKDDTAKADWDECHWFSAVADSSNNVHVVYVDSDDNDLNYVYYNGSSWSSPTEIYKGTITHPTLTYDSTNNNLYAFFIESGRVRYVVASGTSWYNAATNLKINLNFPSYLGSAYSDTSKISIIWREGTSSPYTISFTTLTCGITPSAVHLKGGVELRGGVPTNHTLQLEPR